jgi:hypothetical protein
MQVVPNADWSVGFNSFSSNSLMDTRVLAKLGLGLRGLYHDLTEEPVPEFLASYIDALERREQRQELVAD